MSIQVAGCEQLVLGMNPIAGAGTCFWGRADVLPT